MQRISLLLLLALSAACAMELPDEEGHASHVVPIDWSLLSVLPPDDAAAAQLRALLLNSNRYALTTWYDDVKDFDAVDASLLDLTDGGEHDIRPVVSEALAIAVSLRLGVYDAAIVGVSAEVAEERALWLVRSAAASHRSNARGGWGYGWQTALWADYAGTAAWLLWDALPASDADNVVRMVLAEARGLVGAPTLYFQNADEITKFTGDSKAEENAWNAQFLYLAINMMPGLDNVAAWESKAAELAISAYARPSDVVSSEVVSGRPLAQWLLGSNANQDSTVINHGIIHPDYMVTAAYVASAPIWYGLRGRATPDAMFANIPQTYAALTDLSWAPSLAYPGTSCVNTPCACDSSLRCIAASPGGTIYRAGSSDIYFPHGNDWGTGRRMNFVLFDVIARELELDTLATVKGDAWATLHAAAVLAQQGQSVDGRTYAFDSEDTYPSREEWVAAHAALAWMVRYVRVQGASRRTDAFVDVVLDNREPYPAFTTTGEWAVVARGGQLGMDSLRTGRGDARDGSTAIWRPRVPRGTYDVYAWWDDEPDLTTRAVFTVMMPDHAERVVVDQREGGARWVLLGRYQLDDGVRIELTSADANGAVAADAIRLARVD